MCSYCREAFERFLLLSYISYLRLREYVELFTVVDKGHVILHSELQGYGWLSDV